MRSGAARENPHIAFENLLHLDERISQAPFSIPCPNCPEDRCASNSQFPRYCNVLRAGAKKLMLRACLIEKNAL